MKINFWQTLGLILMLLGVAGIVYREFGAPGKTPATRPAASTTVALVDVN